VSHFGGSPENLNQKSAIKLLEAHGWTKGRGGKHDVKMQKPGRPRPITLPHHKRQDYPPWLRAAILRKAGLTKGDEDG